MEKGPIHTKIGRSSCCDFYSCNCPSLGIATAAEQKYSPPATGMWDSSGEKSQQEPAPPPEQHREQELGAQLSSVGAEPGSEHCSTSQVLCPAPAQAAGWHSGHRLPRLLLCCAPSSWELLLPCTAPRHTAGWKHRPGSTAADPQPYLYIPHIPTYFMCAHKHTPPNLLSAGIFFFFNYFLISVYGTYKKPLWFPLTSGMDLLTQHHQP